MTTKQIKDNAPDGATGYGMWNKKLYYVKGDQVFLKTGELVDANPIFLKQTKPL